MERTKNEKVLIIIFLLLTSFSSPCWSQPYTHTPFKEDTILVSKILSKKYVLSQKVDFLDKRYMFFKNYYDISFCIAAPGQKFSSGDVLEEGTCWDRLVFAGKSRSDKSDKDTIQFVVYEDGRLGGKSCDIFEADSTKVTNYVTFRVGRTTTNFKSLKKLVLSKEYYIFYAGRFLKYFRK